MTLKETILEIQKRNLNAMPLGKSSICGVTSATNEITALIEKDYYEKEFTEWFKEDENFLKCYINNEVKYLDRNRYDAWTTAPQLECYLTIDEVYKFWKANVKEVKDTITTHDLKSIDQASDEYYERDKLFERKK